MGHNLDIAGAAEKASMIFQTLLIASPSDSRANYMYGAFLAGAGKSREALHYLKKAFSAGVIDAAYSLGMTQLTLGNKQKALEFLEAYQKHKPDDEKLPKLIDEIRNGKFVIKHSPLEVEGPNQSCLRLASDC